MRKFMVIALPVVALILFIAIMLSGNILKNSLSGEDAIPQAIATLMQDIEGEKWDLAATHTEQLENNWKRVVRRIQFSSERNEINDFSVNIARLKGCIRAKDKSSGLQELAEAYEHWEDLGK